MGAAVDLAGVEEEGAAKRPRFELFGPEALAAEVPPMRWLVRGVWADNSHGPLAGAKKSFKSWNALALAIAVASGKPYLGKFEVERTGPVLYLNGEGGIAPFQRRYQRLCKAMAVDSRSIPLHATFDTGEIGSPAFKGAVGAHIEAIDPALLILDPLYVYHPAGIEAQNLYDRGPMLGGLSTFVGYERSLVVVDHYRKAGGGNLDLDEIGQSGVAQWADSWILQAHRQEPDLEGGSIKLAVEYGSRQWGGKRQEVDWEFGAWDPELNEPVGQIEWGVEAGSRVSKRTRAGDSDVERAIVALLDGAPWKHSKEEASSLVYTQMKGSGATRAQVRDAWVKLADGGLIRPKKAEGEDGKKRDRWGPGAARIAIPAAG